MTYQKAKVEVLSNMPVAGGCGDRSDSVCHAMVAISHGPGCGDRSETVCHAMTAIR